MTTVNHHSLMMVARVFSYRIAELGQLLPHRPQAISSTLLSLDLFLIQFLVDYVQLGLEIDETASRGREENLYMMLQGLEIDETTSRALRRVCEIILMNLEMMMSNHGREENLYMM
ncbi:hypothetical protein L1987_86048 [Smallanthus sonchifolius]|uniref:Uncharacterized protein n=1 Tax=Smallanthus sonchifolius TaxID=185202 RepID=A0ACB8XYN2_9ASTR|nr:hypothetical protein L1987_86048 [Smallanthus sonchifolius]